MTRIPASDVRAVRHALRAILRGSWRRRRVPLDVDVRLGRRHLGVLAYVASEDGPTVGQTAEALGISLPAASKLAGDLAGAGLVERHEDPEDRRRTVLRLGGPNAPQVQAWLTARDRPLVSALESLTADERTAFLKGLNALGEALMEESAHGSFGPHHRARHHRGPHRHRPL